MSKYSKFFDEMHFKIHPQACPSSSNPLYFTSKQETFTLWLKSLVLSGKGCTVFDSNGQVVFRVDNYHCKRSNEVHLMDFRGKVLFTMQRKKFKLLDFWDGYRPTSAEILDKTTPCFQVRKKLGIFVNGHTSYKVVIGPSKNIPSFYEMGSWTNTSACKIVDHSGGLVAEVRRKQSTRGVMLGEDVLTMVVEPYIDYSLVTGLVIVYNLFRGKM